MKKSIILLAVVVLLSGCANKPQQPQAGLSANQKILVEEQEMLRGVQLAAQVMEHFSELEKLFQMELKRTVSGIGELPCDRHDGTLWRLQGSRSHDVINCSWGSEIILGRKGNDQIDAGWGNDALHGGSGNDMLKGGRGNDVIYGGPGDDIIEGGWGDEVINGGPGDDQIDTSWGNAVVLFGENWGNDTLDVTCNGAKVVLIFSKEIKEDSLVWSGKTLVDRKTHNKITFKGSTSCLNMVFSDQRFI